jgi:hypothetical protein
VASESGWWLNRVRVKPAGVADAGLWDVVVDLLPRVGRSGVRVSGTSLGWMAVVGESPVRESMRLVVDDTPE